MAKLSQLHSQAQLLSEERGVRLTPQRKRVYEIILERKRIK